MDKEIAAFIVKAETKLKHSEALFEIEGYADSVSLSYYSMYLCAKALLIKKDCDIPKTHNGLIQLFSLKYVHEDDFKYNVYKYLANAQSNREDADYSAIDDIDEDLAKKRIVEAKDFLKETKKFL
ncbi:HEPN domain-containing protein [uncultured Methanobrevibacter sp.]|uniref:HEPN domain-containing protein n=1 Tax=uncultured Methanobrevibacter sp. TaxID=253161 RepID=UPI0025FD196B|nr:HEPN domain-containing protein [uncultured Methanobrevibacter sp.]